MSNNRLIAKNSIYLYLRLIISLVISLYASRIILAALGIDDFGIYNVVGSIVAMLSVFSGSLDQAISRFITYEIGKGNIDRLKLVFSSSVFVTTFFATIIFVLGGCICSWFLNNKINIVPERIDAANWVMWFSLATFCVKIFSSPYIATIMAHERMKTYAYLSLLDSLLLLLCILTLENSPFDHLILYGLYVLVISIVMRIGYGAFCILNFQECKLSLKFEPHLLKGIFSFAGWNMYGGVIYILNIQGLSILLNLFFGVMVNAARGISNQVGTAISSFSSNILNAINPQITKSYAAGDVNRMCDLICKGTKLSFFLMLLFTVPLIFETKMVLSLWLVQVPQYAVDFTRISLISAQILVLGNEVGVGVFATGRIKAYVAYIGSLGLLVLPITYLLLLNGGAPIYAYYVYFGVYVIMIPFRIALLDRYVGISSSYFYKEVVLRCMMVAIIVFTFSYLIHISLPESLSRLFLLIIATGIFVIALSLIGGMDKVERKTVINFVRHNFLENE